MITMIGSSLSQIPFENAIFQTRFRESLPRFTINVFESTLWRCRTFGIVHLPNGVDIEYRRKYANKHIFLRVRGVGGQWRSIQTHRLRANKKLRRLVCPFCTSSAKLLYAIGPKRSDWRCEMCIQKPSGLPSKESRQMYRAIQNGNLQMIAQALSSDRPWLRLQAMIAMQMAGLRQSSLTVGRHPQFKVSRYKRLKCRSNGTLIYVGGKLYAR